MQNLGLLKKFEMTKNQDKKTTFFRFNGVDVLHANFPFILFMALLVIVYIGNAHSAEKKKRQLQALKSEVKEARWQYEIAKNKVIYGSTQSQLAKKLDLEDRKLRVKVPKTLSDTRIKK